MKKLFDLPDEILLLICRYLSLSDILYSFCTPKKPESRLHRVISDYYRKIKIDRIKTNEFIYLLDLLSCSNSPFDIQSLVLSNEYIPYLIECFFINLDLSIIELIFRNLKSLELIDCSERDVLCICAYDIHFQELEHLSIRMYKDHGIENMNLNKYLFNEKFRSIKRIFLEIHCGFSLNKSLICHENLRNVDLILQTIDDLFILLDGLIPNVEILIIRLCQKKHFIQDEFHSKTTSKYLHLIDFTLIDLHADIFMDNIKLILSFMPNLNKLTLSIHDTFDWRFCHGPYFESILNEYLPNLRQFDYTMTHFMEKQTVIKDFVRWPMIYVYYGNELYPWIHIYSLPWPSSRNDKRQLPIDRHHGSKRSITSDVQISQYRHHLLVTHSEQFSQLKNEFIRVRQLTICLSIDIQLPLRIYKLIIASQTLESPLNNVVQPSIRHLVVEHHLTDVDDLFKLANQFPHVQYLKLRFQVSDPSFINYFQTIFTLADSNENQFKFWSKLIHLTVHPFYSRSEIVKDSQTFYDWLWNNTDLKSYKSKFYVHFSHLLMSIWF